MRLFEPGYGDETPQERAARIRRGNLRDNSGHLDGSMATLHELSAKKIHLTEEDGRHLADLYNAEIAFVDAGIGELVAKLKDLGLYDRTLIILHSDHGEGFGEHGFWYHGTTVYDEMARVPLIIKPPDSKNANKVVWGQVRNIDIGPTILDYCGLSYPQGCDGQSLRPFIETDAVPDLPAITETQVGKKSHLVAFRHRGHKLIYDVLNDKAWLYDLRADPGERTTLLPDSSLARLASADSSAAVRLEGQLRQELLETLGIDQLADLELNPEDMGPIDERTKELLKSLGYIE
jgi:arylsulfatase A-like enzyme